MTFKKSSDTSLTEMAVWVDSAEVFSCDKDTLVEYLYHLVLFNAKQRSLFNDQDSYDDFSLFCVSKLLIRLNNTLKEPVKSIVNYIKNVLDPWHAEYVRTFCVGSPELNISDFNVSDFSDYLIDSSSENDYRVYDCFCLKVSDVVQKHLKRIPRKKHSCEWSNIYVSCLLTLQDRIETAANLSENSIVTQDPIFLSRVIRELKTRAPILFHIDESMSGYISVLVNEITHAIAAEISCSVASKITPSECLKHLVIAAANEEEEG